MLPTKPRKELPGTPPASCEEAHLREQWNGSLPEGLQSDPPACSPMRERRRRPRPRPTKQRKQTTTPAWKGTHGSVNPPHPGPMEMQKQNKMRTRKCDEQTCHAARK